MSPLRRALASGTTGLALLLAAAVRGDRGGSDTIVGGAYGLVAVLVMFAVIL